MWWPKDFYCEISIQRSGEKDTYHDQLCKGSLNDAFNIMMCQVIENSGFRFEQGFFIFSPNHSAPTLEKKCNFKSTKTHYLHFQKWQKINFCTRKKSENCIFGSFKLFSGAKIDFLPFLKMQIMFFCTFEIALFFQF